LELPNISVTVHNALDTPTLLRTARHLQRVLRKTASTVTLRIESADAAAVERLLRRLARHGDRVFVSAGDTLREMIDVDWSRFQLAAVPLPTRTT
ncbi:MAG TPA: hypothetical protein VG323_21340, partial [Thermoanaerobaculia bacterium]|nr:hypothetical protein [Thermoanaerobaculia bacterium]